MREFTIVAFTGKRGSGKSEAAKALVEELGFVEVKFADPLKDMLRALYQSCGVDAETVERKLEGDLKEKPCQFLLGKTPRYAMQTLGTEWRDMLGKTLWSEIFAQKVQSGQYGTRIVCSDYRFPHEGDVLDHMGARLYRISRPAADSVQDEAAQHPSEALVETIPVDEVILNDGTLEDLRNAVIRQVCNDFE